MQRTPTVHPIKLRQANQLAHQEVASPPGASRLMLMVMIAALGMLVAACTSTDNADTEVDASDDTDTEEVEEEPAETDDDENDDGDVANGDGDAAASNEQAEGDSGSNRATDEEVGELVEVLGYESLDEVEIPMIDVETLEAETPARTYQAERYQNAFVGEVTDDLFIGVSLDSQYTGQASEVSIYLCNEQGAVAYLTGELDDGSATLSNKDAEIDLDVAEDEISGTVKIAGEDEQSFTAMPATGDAGLYAVATPVDDIEAWAHWIVLDDGRQRGDICLKTPFIDVFICAGTGGGKIATK